MMIDQWNFIPYLFHKPICGISYALFMKWFPLIDTLVFFTDDTDGLAPSCAKLVYLYICSWQEYLPECSSFIVREGWGPHMWPCFLFQNLIAAMWRCLIIRTLLIAIYVYIYIAIKHWYSYNDLINHTLIIIDIQTILPPNCLNQKIYGSFPPSAAFIFRAKSQMESAQSALPGDPNARKLARELLEWAKKSVFHFFCEGVEGCVIKFMVFYSTWYM